MYDVLNGSVSPHFSPLLPNGIGGMLWSLAVGLKTRVVPVLIAVPLCVAGCAESSDSVRLQEPSRDETRGVAPPMVIAAEPDEDSDGASVVHSGPELILDASQPDDGLRGTLSAEGRTIHFEAYRIQPVADDVALVAPELAFEVDARILDSSGDTFAILVGGHAPSFPDWAAENNDPNLTESFDPELREADVLLALMLPELLGRLALRPDMAPELGALASLVGAIEHGIGQAPDLNEDTGVHEIDSSLSGQKAACSRYQRVLYLGYDPIFFSWGHHSAVSVSVYNNNTTTCVSNAVPARTYVHCNHGRCPTGSGMSERCRKSIGSSSSTVSLTASNGCGTSTSSADTTGCCRTSYRAPALGGGAISSTADDGGHVCNDDTRRELDAFWGRTYYSPGYCEDTVLQRYAPSSCN